MLQYLIKRDASPWRTKASRCVCDNTPPLRVYSRVSALRSLKPQVESGVGSRRDIYLWNVITFRRLKSILIRARRAIRKVVPGPFPTTIAEPFSKFSACGSIQKLRRLSHKFRVSLEACAFVQGSAEKIFRMKNQGRNKPPFYVVEWFSFSKNYIREIRIWKSD